LKYLTVALVVLVIIGSCSSPSPYEGNLIYEIAKSDPELLAVLDEAEKYRIQIIYTQVKRDSVNRPILVDHTFRLNTEEYFYPASTVKLPVAALSLEMLNRLNIEGLDRNTSMLTDSAFFGQSKVVYDSTSETNLPSVGHYIKKILLVSDNDAFNRLYEFLGQDYINEMLHEKGYQSARIVHRLSLPLSEEENRWTNPVTFVNGNDTVYRKPILQAVGTPDYNEEVLLGKGEIAGGELKESPKDFSRKNRLALADLHRMVIAIMQPEAVPEENRFNLTENDYVFLRKYMRTLPSDAEYPSYDTEHYWDSYVKFFMFGDTKLPMPSNVHIYNKVGAAYGFLIDAAYIEDRSADVGFYLSAVIHTNDNGIFNDDTYEYDQTGFPFLAKIGRAIYNYEVERLAKPAAEELKAGF